MKKRTKSPAGTQNKVIEGEAREVKSAGGKKPKTKAIAKVERNLPRVYDQTPEGLIAQAIDKGTSVETMERLLAMRRELRAEKAKEAFDRAMASFQEDCPVIKKTKVVRTKAGEDAYRYAPLESIVSQVKPLLKQHGFSYSTQTMTGEKLVKAICTAKHEGGHSESSEMEVPLGNKTAVMSESQVTAAAITFAKRYAFCNVFGILTGDQDNDAALVNVPDEKKKDPTNYLDLLKMAIHKKGAKNPAEAVEVFNNITGLTIKEFPNKNDEQTKGLYQTLVDSPSFSSL